ncbi:hypothetical protein FACS1894184_16350 [Clostridia bacterium]|nr:hypothetical protein FACS1894184_16350 [Clostridia bacterium]
MISVKTTVKEIKKQAQGLDDLANATKYLQSHMAMVGVPQESNSTNGSGNITNAELLFIHDHGSPKRGIPARPVLEPAIDGVQDQISEMLMEAMKAALDGSEGGAASALEKAGQYGENAAKAYFTGANGWTPLKEATIKEKGSSQPLIDTGSMRSSITHVIEEI